MADQKIIDESSPISKKRGNGLIRCEVWVDAKGKVTRYNLAYINHSLQHKDNGRVVGYDNHQHVHHRHYMGKVEVVTYTSFDDIQERFERDWTMFLEQS